MRAFSENNFKLFDERLKTIYDNIKKLDGDPNFLRQKYDEYLERGFILSKYRQQQLINEEEQKKKKKKKKIKKDQNCK